MNPNLVETEQFRELEEGILRLRDFSSKLSLDSTSARIPPLGAGRPDAFALFGLPPCTYNVDAVKISVWQWYGVLTGTIEHKFPEETRDSRSVVERARKILTDKNLCTKYAKWRFQKDLVFDYEKKKGNYAKDRVPTQSNYAKPAPTAVKQRQFAIPGWIKSVFIWIGLLIIGAVGVSIAAVCGLAWIDLSTGMWRELAYLLRYVHIPTAWIGEEWWSPWVIPGVITCLFFLLCNDDIPSLVKAPAFLGIGSLIIISFSSWYYAPAPFEGLWVGKVTKVWTSDAKISDDPPERKTYRAELLALSRSQVSAELLSKLGQTGFGIFCLIEENEYGKNETQTGHWDEKEENGDLAYQKKFGAKLSSSYMNATYWRNGHFVSVKLRYHSGRTVEWVFEKQRDVPAGFFLDATDEEGLERMARQAF